MFFFFGALNRWVWFWFNSCATSGTVVAFASSGIQRNVYEYYVFFRAWHQVVCFGYTMRAWCQCHMNTIFDSLKTIKTKKKKQKKRSETEIEHWFWLLRPWESLHIFNWNQIHVFFSSYQSIDSAFVEISFIFYELLSNGQIHSIVTIPVANVVSRPIDMLPQILVNKAI